MRRFVVTCRHCGRRVLEAPRLEAPHLVRLLAHLRDKHPDRRVPADAPAGTVLAHFTVAAPPGSA
jgi:hypothetical protein